MSNDKARWQPIETAPQGSMCLFADMTAKEARDWAFVDWVVGAQFCGDRRRNATHWMPLPEPPPMIDNAARDIMNDRSDR